MLHSINSFFFIICIVLSTFYLISCTPNKTIPVKVLNHSNISVVSHNKVNLTNKSNGTISPLPKFPTNKTSHYIKKNNSNTTTNSTKISISSKRLSKNTSISNSTNNVSNVNYNVTNNHSNVPNNKPNITHKLNTTIKVINNNTNNITMNKTLNQTVHLSEIKISNHSMKKVLNARENEKLFAKDEKSKLFLQHKKRQILSTIEDEIKKISSTAEFKNCLELDKFNFKSFLEVFAIIVMISIIILIYNYLSDYSTKKKYYENQDRKYSLTQI